MQIWWFNWKENVNSSKFDGVKTKKRTKLERRKRGEYSQQKKIANTKRIKEKMYEHSKKKSALFMKYLSQRKTHY